MVKRRTQLSNRKIMRVIPSDDYSLLVHFDNGELRVYYMQDALFGALEILKDIEKFREAFIDEYGCIAWDIDPMVDSATHHDNRIDLCTDEVYRYSEPWGLKLGMNDKEKGEYLKSMAELLESEIEIRPSEYESRDDATIRSIIDETIQKNLDNLYKELRQTKNSVLKMDAVQEWHSYELHELRVAMEKLQRETEAIRKLHEEQNSILLRILEKTEQVKE